MCSFGLWWKKNQKCRLILIHTNFHFWIDADDDRINSYRAMNSFLFCTHTHQFNVLQYFAVAPFSYVKCLTWRSVHLFCACKFGSDDTHTLLECVLHATRMDIGKSHIEIMSIGELSAPKIREVKHIDDIDSMTKSMASMAVCGFVLCYSPSLFCFLLNWMSIDGFVAVHHRQSYQVWPAYKCESNETKEHNNSSIPIHFVRFCELLATHTVTSMNDRTNQWMMINFIMAEWDGVRL